MKSTGSNSLPWLRKLASLFSSAAGNAVTRLMVIAAVWSAAPIHALDLTVAPGGNIQSAIDQVNAAGGGNVILQAGTYTIVSALLIRGGITVKGAGSASTTIQNTGPAADYSFFIGPGTGTGITIRDLAMDGRNSVGGNGLALEGSTNTSYNNLSLLNLEVRNIGYMGLHPKGVTGITQTNNYVHHSGRFSLAHNQYFRRTNNVNTSGCRFEDSPAGDGAKFTFWDGVTVTNCTFNRNFNRGLRNQETNSNGSFTYNTLIGNALDGMELVGSNLTISNNGAYANGWSTDTTFRNGIRTGGGSGTVSNNNSYGNYGATYDIHGSFTWTTLNNTDVAPVYPVVQAESATSSFGIQLENCADTGGGQDVGYINNNDYVAYSALDLTGVGSLDLRVASNNAAGCTIEVRLDSITGPLVGTATVATTTGWQKWVTRSAAISGASGVHDVYLLFKGGSGFLCNVNWLQFKYASPWTAQEAWRLQYFETPAHNVDNGGTGPAGDYSDPEGDGVVNLLEYAFGTDPLTASQAPTGVFSPDSQVLQITFPRLRAELTYLVEVSDDLIIWSTLATNPGTVGATITVSDTATPSTHPRRFIRLQVIPPGT